MTEDCTHDRLFTGDDHDDQSYVSCLDCHVDLKDLEGFWTGKCFEYNPEENLWIRVRHE